MKIIFCHVPSLSVINFWTIFLNKNLVGWYYFLWKVLSAFLKQLWVRHNLIKTYMYFFSFSIDKGRLSVLYYNFKFQDHISIQLRKFVPKQNNSQMSYIYPKQLKFRLVVSRWPSKVIFNQTCQHFIADCSKFGVNLKLQPFCIQLL